MYPSKASFTILLEVWAIMFSLDKALYDLNALIAGKWAGIVLGVW